MKTHNLDISWWRIDFSKKEINHIANSIKHQHISQGPVTFEFEQQIGKILNVPYVIATNSGSAALLMSLISIGIKPGDEVIIPNRAWISVAHAPLLLGAKVVMVDVEINQPTMNVNDIVKNITPRTKAIIPVHLNGRSVKMEKINNIAKKNNIVVIEDAAQAFCSRNKKGFLGNQSSIGCFSLSMAKIISTAQGGFIITKKKKIYDKLKLIRTHGIRDHMYASYAHLGFNFKFTDIQASIGIEQLKKLPNNIEKVKKIYRKYAKLIDKLSFLKLIPVNIEAGEIPIYIEVICKNRKKLMNYLHNNKIQTRPFYPDINTANYFNSTKQFPNSKNFEKKGLFLPSGPGQSLEKIDRVLKVLTSYDNI